MKRQRLLWPEIGVWVALLVLLTATLVSAYLPLGLANGPINYAIALVKALLVAVLFMRLREAKPLVRLAAVVGLFWLGSYFLLTFGDYLTR
jgi:cytochrome c oxidase subunit 4